MRPKYVSHSKRYFYEIRKFMLWHMFINRTKVLDEYKKDEIFTHSHSLSEYQLDTYWWNVMNSDAITNVKTQTSLAPELIPWFLITFDWME